MTRKGASDVRMYDTIGRTVTITQTGANAWELRQRFLGKKTDNAQNPTWVRVINRGPARKIEIVLYWANVEWPHWRGSGYQKIGEDYSAVRGEAAPDRTTYRVRIPSGTSWFGAWPWYANEDVDAFVGRAVGEPRCRTRVIGESERRRPIRCVTIGDEKRGARNVVVLARTHATEVPGSFAVEGIADFLLNTRAGQGLLKGRAFHLFPNVNPDGVAAGLKLTRRGPRDKYDMAAAAMSSDDGAMVALREEVSRLRPACLIDYHSYLQSVPGAFFLDDKLGLAVLRELLRGAEDESGYYYRSLLPDNRSHRNTLWTHCFHKYQTTVAVFELTWSFGLLPDDVARMGVDMFRAAMKAHGKR